MRNKMKRFLSILLSLVMVLGLMPGMSLTAYADNPEVKYLDENGMEQSITNYTVMNDNTYELFDGWYVLKDVVTVDFLSVRGNVNLILCDNAKFTLDSNWEGFRLDEGKSLTIYAQSTGDKMGKFYVTAGREAGLDLYMANLIINGGDVSFTGKDENGNGIAGYESSIYINGGSLTANGAWDGISSVGISINGGSLTANGGDYGSGIFLNDEELELIAGELVATGGMAISYGNVKNTFAGKGWDMEGTATDIAINTQGQSLEDYKKVEFREPVALNKKTASLDVGETIALTAKVNIDNITDKTVKWSVSGTDSGAVKLYSDQACTNEVGAEATDTLKVYVKGISAGSATVNVTSNADGTKSNKCEVTAKDELYPLWVGGVQVKKSNKDDILGDADEGATAKYTPAVADDPATTQVDESAPATLTLNGYTYSGEGFDTGAIPKMSVIYYRGEDSLAILANGENSITCTTEKSGGICSNNSKGDLIIGGTGSLYSEGGSYGIFSLGTITIDGGKITARASAQAIRGTKGVLIAGGTVDAQAQYGITGTETEYELQIGPDVDSVIIKGTGCATDFPVKNAIPGIGWTDVEGTSGRTSIDVSETGQSLSNEFKKVQFSPITYNVTVTPGSNMTKTETSGAASQTGLTGAMTPVVYTANEGYYFPKDYDDFIEAVNGISVTRNSYTQITVSGTPNDDAAITLPAPTAKKAPTSGDFYYSVPDSFEYDGTPKAVSVEPDAPSGVEGMGEITVQYYSDSSCTITADPTDAGTYYVGITVAEGDAYRATSTVLHHSDWMFTISEADAVAATVTANNRTYDGTDKALVNVTGEAEGGEMQYALGENATTAPANNLYSTSIPTGTAPGTYYVWYKVVADSNHNDTDPVCVQDIEIGKIKAELNWSDLTLKYTGQPQLPTATIKNKVKDDEVTVVLTGAATDAGFYEAAVDKLEGKDAGNYILPDEDLSRYYNIVKGTHQISVSIEDWTYGDEPKVPVVTGEPDGRKATIEYKSQEDNIYVSDVPVDAGKYTVRATLDGDNNYESASAEYNFTVYPKEVILTWGDTEFTYNGKDQIPEVTVSGLVGEDSVEAVVIGDATAVGTHTAMVMSLAGAGASNYKLPAAVKTTFTIAKADIPVDQGDNPAKLTMPGWIYGDDAADPVIENNIGGGTVNYSYAKSGIGMADPEDLVFESKKPSAAGLYIVKAEISATENYYGATLYAPFVITPRTAKLEWGDTSFVYDGKEHVPACEVANKVYGDKCFVTVSGSASTVGEHKASAIKLSNDNYVLPASGNQNFTISKDGLDLSVSMTGWVYGDEANAPLVEGNKGNADITYTYYTDEDLSAKTGTAEGAVAEGGIPSYAGTYFVQASAAATDGYEADVAVAEFTIEKRMPVIEWSDISLTYNAKAQKPVAEITNKVEGDELILTVYGEAVDAGDYEAVLTVSGAAADNYETPAITTQRFRINKLAAELAWGETRFVYNGSDQVPTVSVNNLIKGDEMALTVVGAATAVGEHTATVTKLSNANYALPEETSKVFYIEKADVATDEGQSENPAMFAMADWIYGETAPEPVLENNIGGGTVTFGYALLPEGTEPASYGELDYTTVKPKAAGVYVAKADIGATENYNSATLYDLFVIEPKTASLTWSDTSVIYDGEEHTPSCEVSNLEFSDECEVTVSGNAIAAGEHSAWAIALSNDNYVLPTSTKTTFVISKGTPALTVNMAGWTYGDEAAVPVVEGNDGEGNVSFAYYRDEELTEKTGTGDGAAVNGDIPAYAGTYYVAATAEETDGYNSAVATAEFTIEKRQLAFTWTGFALTYDGKEHLPAAAPENVATGDELSVIISGTQKAAGEYEAVIEGIEGERADNYVLPEDLTQAFKIAKKAAELKWGSTEFIYTGKDQIPTVEVANLEEGDVCELTVTGAATAVGTHKATAISISNDNYELPAELEKSFTIVKADLNEDAKVIINDWTYDENPSVPRVEGNIEGANVTYKYKKAGADDSSYTTTVPVNAGDYTVIAIIDTTAGYNEKPVTADFTIRKAESRIEKAPKAVAGLFYDATVQELVTKGEAFGGKVVYAAVSENQIEPEDGVYTEAVATGILSGTYYVWYKVAGDANHNDSDAAMTEAVIRPVTRENLIDYIGEVTGYHDEIKGEEDYADIAKDLKDAIDAAQLAADDDNVTDEQIGQAIKALSDAHNDAMDRVQDVIDTKAAKAVTDMIKALPAADKVEVYDEQAVRDAVRAYEELTDPQKAKMDGADVKKLDDVLKSLEVVLEPYRKMAASNKNRDRLVALLNSRGFDTINGIYQTPYDTVSMNYTVAKGRITHVSFDVKNLKDGDNFLTMNTGTRMILTDKFTVVDNFANKRDYRKVAKSLKLKDYGYVLDVKKLKGRSTYEMILVSADGRKRLIIDVVDLALNKKGLRKAALTTPVKEAEVGAKAVSENKISDGGCAENGGVITITSAPVLKSEIDPRKNRSARFISGVWMVGGTAITYGRTQTVTKGKVTVYAKVNSDGTLSIAKAEGSGKGSMPITYILNGKVIVKKNKTSMRSKTYRAKVKVK